jgi:hypothetical protein
MPPLLIVGLIVFIGAMGAMATFLFHWFCVIMDLLRRDRPWWVLFAGPFNLIIPSALTDYGRTHRTKAFIWLVATGALFGLSLAIKALAQ